jgi:ferredoxin
MEYRIEIDRTGCIACGTCYSVDPVHFESDDEGKSKVIDGQTDASGSTGVFDDDEIENAQNAEDNCPVGVIVVTED